MKLGANSALQHSQQVQNKLLMEGWGENKNKRGKRQMENVQPSLELGINWLDIVLVMLKGRDGE